MEHFSKIFRALPITALLLSALSSSAQLVVTGTTDIDVLASSIAGNGVNISNAQITCASNGFGYYNAQNTNLASDDGVLLTTGDISVGVGPNDEEDGSANANTPGSAILTTVTNRTTYDACMLEFDIVPRGDTLSFDFVFASEEYNEWVGSQYNDVFGFFISGPGIAGDPGIGSDHNIALIPNTAIPITINNVNANINPQYFFDNPNGGTVQYDGFTQGLKAISAVQPCETYHLKLVIADASDRMWDSGVFIEKIESNDVGMSSTTVNGLDQMIEGCNDGTVTFTRQTATSQSEDVTFYLSGSATNGIDYPLVGTDPDPLVAKTITIPANQLSVDLNIVPTPDGITEGTEEVIIYLGNDMCPGVYLDSLTFLIHDSLHTAVFPPGDTICIGRDLQLVALGGNTFTWSPSTFLDDPNTQNPITSPDSSITYTLTTSAGTCTETVEVPIVVVELTVDAVISNTSCNGSNDGSIDLTVNGGIGPFMINWTGPNGFSSNDEDLSGLAPGQYVVIVADQEGCNAFVAFDVLEAAPILLSLDSPVLTFGQNISCHGGNDGSIDLDITGGQAAYNVLWSGPNGFTSTDEDLAYVPAGTYNVLVTDQNGCTAIGNIDLFEPDSLQLSISAQNDVLCASEQTGSAMVGVSGGVGPYSVEWNTSPITSGTNASGLPAGTYTVSATDAYGCISQIDVQISEPATALSALVDSVQNVLCYNDSTGAVFTSVSGGTPPYSYTWNTTPPTNTATLTNVPVGFYDLTVLDSNGCSTVLSVFVDGPDEEIFAAIQTQTNVGCFEDSTGSATLTLGGGSGSLSVVWNTTPPQYGPVVSGLPVGSYTAVVTDNNGCAHSKMVVLVITGPSAPLNATWTTSLFGGGYEVSCFGADDGTIDLSPNGGTMPYYYTWVGSDGSTTGTEDLSGLSAGTYYINIADANGCVWNDSITLNAPDEIILAATPSETNCQGANDGSIDLTIGGGIPAYAVAWTGPNGFSSSDEDISGLEAGTYSVQVTDSNGCIQTLDVIVAQPGDLVISSILSNYPGGENLSCNGASDGTIDLSVNGGSAPYSFQWSGPNGFNSTNEDITGLIAGSFTVLVTDDNGCTIDQLITLTQPSEITIDLSAVVLNGGMNVSCAGSADGQVDASISGGVPGYNVSWTGPNGFSASNEDIFGLEAGVYYIAVSDQNNCTELDSIELIAPDPLLAASTSPILNGGANVSCNGGADGSIDLDLIGGTGPFSFSWIGPNGFTSSDEDPSGLEAGTYMVTITDSNGCSTSTSITLTAAPEIILSSTSPTVYGGWNISCNGGSDGSLDLTISGGVPTYTINWNGPNGFSSSNEDITSLEAGMYTALVTDANGCTSSISVELTEPAPLDVQIDVSTFIGGGNVSCIGASDGSIDLTISGGTINYATIWNGPNAFYSGDEDLSGLGPGTYYIDITDANGCSLSDSVVLIGSDSLILDLTANVLPGGFNISCPGASDGQIDLSIPSGNGPFTFNWTGPNGFTSSDEDPSGLFAGTYTVLVSDTNGCSANASINLIEPLPILISSITSSFPGGNNVSCAGANDGAIDLNVSGGSAPYQFNWVGPGNTSFSTEDLVNIGAGTYDVTVTDTSGCSAQLSITLNDPVDMSTTLSANAFPGGANVSCSGSSDGAIDLTVNGGTPAFSYVWSGPNGFSSIDEDLSGLSAGSYLVVATDTNGCSVMGNIDILEPDSLSIDLYSPIFAGGFNIPCAGDTSGVLEASVLGGTPGYTYSWNGPDNFTSNSANITGLSVGTYTVSVADTNGCAVQSGMTLTQPLDTLSGTLSALLQSSGTNISCHGGSDGAIDATILGGISGYTFDWRGPMNYVDSIEDISGLIAGEYELVVIDTNECPLTLTITLTEPDTGIFITPTLSEFPGGANLRCSDSNDGSIDLLIDGGSPAYSLTWSGPNGYTSTATYMDSLSAGTYSVQVVDTNACLFADSITLIAPDPLFPILDPFTFPGGTNISCFGMDDGSINVNITGGNPTYDHLWTGPVGWSSIDLNIADLAPGDYCLSITDTNACAAMACVTLIEPAQMVLSSSSDTALCGQPTGNIDLAINGGSAPYAFDWSGISTNEDLIDAAAGTYTVYVTDANGCLDSLTTDIVGIDGVDGNGLISDVLCNGDNTGSIDLSITSGTSPFTYNWSNNEQSEDIFGLVAGSYTVTVLDSNGCEMISTFNVDENDPIALDTLLSDFNGYNVSTHQGSDGVIELLIGGATPPYTYLWSTGDTTAFVNGLPAGTYTVTITDANGCERTVTIELTEPLDLIMPTGFSPNGDGANDAFVIQGLDAYPDNSFKVVNRWGNVVFETNNYRNDWSGENMSGAVLPDATYFVILSINGGQRSMAGYVDLRR